MKEKRYLFFGMIVLLLAVLFVPIPRIRSISGEAKMLKDDKERAYAGTVKLSVEIHEWKSLLTTYRRTFSFVADDEQLSEFRTAYYDDIDDCVWIHQPYYDAGKNGFSNCTLGYRKDLSRAELRWNGHIYIISEETDVTYPESEFLG